MTLDDWKKIKHFAQHEFDSPDAPGSGVNMHFDFVQTLDTLRKQLGFPLVITSGYRTYAHNLEVGGVSSSAHTDGWAADLAITSSSQRFRIISTALSLSITRIGVGARFLHLDMDPHLPPNVIWTY